MIFMRVQTQNTKAIEIKDLSFSKILIVTLYYKKLYKFFNKNVYKLY